MLNIPFLGKVIEHAMASQVFLDGRQALGWGLGQNLLWLMTSGELLAA